MTSKSTTELNPVEPNALKASIAELEAWYGSEESLDVVPTSLLESIGLVLHELKRLMPASHEEQVPAVLV